MFCFARSMPTVVFVESTSPTDSTLKMNYQQSSSCTYQCKTRSDIYNNIMYGCLECKPLLFLCQNVICTHKHTHTHSHSNSRLGVSNQQPLQGAGLRQPLSHRTNKLHPPIHSYTPSQYTLSSASCGTAP